MAQVLVDYRCLLRQGEEKTFRANENGPVGTHSLSGVTSTNRSKTTNKRRVDNSFY